ncbi:MAG: hypothetical protein HQK96_08315 [Nitrospirae bacterium]|nr:hypothetical protein [Nitrospirota bacterium]
MAGPIPRNYFALTQPKDNSLAFVMRVNDNSSEGAGGKYLVFPFFPESLSDSKSVNWSNIELPGASHPIYQYVNSGERNITFTAKLLRETRPGLTTLYTSPFNIDINDAATFLRSCLYPKSSNNNSGGATIISAPPICKIKIGGSNFDNKSGLITCIMTQCDIEVTKWWDDDNATPKVAEVSLAFAEIINVFRNVRYVFSDDLVWG